MNKKMMAVTGTILIGVMMLGASAFAAISGTSGYDVYKQALKNTLAAKSITSKTELTLKDNGNVLVELNADAKIDKENKLMSNSTQIVSGESRETLAVYRQADKMIIKSGSSDTYDVMEGKAKKHKRHQENHDDATQRFQDVEGVVDAAMGNMQSLIALQNNADGTKDVSLTLADGQISPVVNAAAALAVKNALGRQGFEDNEKHMKISAAGAIKDKLPLLVSDITIKQVAVDAKISKENFIQQQNVTLTVTGKDTDGKAHELVLDINAGFSGYNNTVPETVELNGKKVNLMTKKMHGHGDK